jgi:hypothetical protein
MKKQVIFLLVLCTISIFGLLVFFRNPFGEHKVSDKSEEYTYQTFQVDKNKWGYLILHFDKPFIKQIHIPAVGGNMSFTNEADAEKTARLVLSKLNKKEIPSLSINELEELGVIPVDRSNNH